MDFTPSKEGSFLVNMLSIQSVSIAYGDNLVVRGVDVEIAAGEIVAVIGPNGAGKTSIIRAVSGTIPLIAGKIWIDGEDAETLSVKERAKRIAVVPQARQMGGAYSVNQAVMMGRTAHMNWLGKESQYDYDCVKNALEQTGLIALADRQIAQLSGGEQQRVLLARALAQKTPILLLDEPTNHLDLHHKYHLLDLVKQLVFDFQLTLMVAMHDLNMVSQIATRIALLINGEIQTLGFPDDVLTKEIIEEAYQVSVEIIHDPHTNKPVIIARGETEELWT